MNKLIKRSFAWGVSVATTILTFVPDSIIGIVRIWNKLTYDLNLLINRISILFIAFVLSIIINSLFDRIRSNVKIRGRNYCIQVEYGDLFECENCQRVISFDECFTTKIGTAPHEIKASSICGQYLNKNSELDIKMILSESGLKPENSRSRYNNQKRYISGTIAPNGDDLLMAFAMLDENGRGFFPSRSAYLESLTVMWSEIHKYFQMKDVCIPVLGGGLTSIGDSNPTQQELIDLIIESYKLYAQKIKRPYKLRIVCRKEDDISLSKVGETI